MKALIVMTIVNFAMFIGAAYMHITEQSTATDQTDESMCFEVEAIEMVEIESAAPTHFIAPSRNRLMCEP